ncbi:MAG TPA: hypothetical protein VF584_26610 [Longimicrobium sp.]
MPDLPPGIPPLFVLVFDTAGTLERVEPVFRELPATFTSAQ